MNHAFLIHLECVVLWLFQLLSIVDESLWRWVSWAFCHKSLDLASLLFFYLQLCKQSRLSREPDERDKKSFLFLPTTRTRLELNKILSNRCRYLYSFLWQTYVFFFSAFVIECHGFGFFFLKPLKTIYRTIPWSHWEHLILAKSPLFSPLKYWGNWRFKIL